MAGVQDLPGHPEVGMSRIFGAEPLLKMLEEKRLHLFYIKTPVKFGVLN